MKSQILTPPGACDYRYKFHPRYVRHGEMLVLSHQKEFRYLQQQEYAFSKFLILLINYVPKA